MTRLIFAAVLLAVTVVVLQLNVNLTNLQVMYLVVSGIVGLVFGDTFLFRSYQYNGARVSMLIMSSSPAVAAVLAYFLLAERLSAWGIVGMVVTLLGISLVVVERSETSNVRIAVSGAGLLYGFLGAAGQGAGLIFARLAFDQGPINGLVATAVRVISATVLLLPVVAWTRHYKNPVAVFKKDRKALALTAAGSVLGPYLGITASLIAVSNTKVGIAATLMATVPIVMLPLMWVIYKERPSWKAVIAALVAVSGVAILFLN
jgi:drug/metabolite transporter (DMT)-like permease